MRRYTLLYPLRLLPATLLLLLLPLLTGAQATLTGTVLDSLTHKPLPFASVFLANTTLGATTTEQGQFVLPNVPAGHYDLVASYVGYQLARRAVTVGPATPPVLTLRLAPAASQLGEVVVRARRHVNRPEDYARFVQLFVGRSTFSQRCLIRNPRDVVVDYDPKARELTAEATTYVQVDNLALGYRLKYYGMHFRASFAREVTSFYGQPVFEELPARNARQRQRWEANRAAAYYGSLPHFLRSLCHGELATQGFVAQKLRYVPNPPFARADSLRRQLLHRARPAVYTTAEQDSLARWAKVQPMLILLYRTPRPLDSLRRVAPDGRQYLRFTDQVQVTYQREAPDPLYPLPPGTPAGRREQVSRLWLLQPEAELQPDGQLVNPLLVFTEGYWGFEKMGEFLPLNYQPSAPPPTP